MKRIVTLTSFFIRDLARSMAAIVPIAATLAFGVIAFEYGMDQAQFITVAGIGMGAISLVTGLLLASRANRASSYLLVVRLRQRSELLAALLVSSLGFMAALGLLMTIANLLAGRLSLEWPSALWVLPTWLAVWALAVTLALALSGLVGRSGSQLAGYVLFVGLLIGNDRKIYLARHGLDWLAQGIAAIIWPVSTLLQQASDGTHGTDYILAWTLTCIYAMLLFALAATLLKRKDLLWSE